MLLSPGSASQAFVRHAAEGPRLIFLAWGVIRLVLDTLDGVRSGFCVVNWAEWGGGWQDRAAIDWMRRQLDG